MATIEERREQLQAEMRKLRVELDTLAFCAPSTEPYPARRIQQLLRWDTLLHCAYVNADPRNIGLYD